MAEIKVTFLGTSSMVPTKERGQTGIYVDCGAEKILIDCGENIQRQMRIARISPPRTTRIFISHWHGDHIFGLPGMLENIGKNASDSSVHVYSSKEVGRKIKQLMDTFDMRNKIKLIFTSIEKNGIFLETKDFKFGANFLKHSSKCLGFYIKEKDKLKIDKVKMKKLNLPSGPIIDRLKNKKNITFDGKKVNWKDVTYLENGKKLAIVLDTGVCSGAVNTAKDADLFICESTFFADKADKAKNYQHLTSVQAGEIAKKANAKKLVITHFSQRYNFEDVEQMRKEAKKAFGKDVKAAEDFSSFIV
ncbi:MAG: ribonuclease Z [Nanoarchaeota archaeon]|nr:ribonuclease Z [Nanoarchaeota archaeon]